MIPYIYIYVDRSIYIYIYRNSFLHLHGPASVPSDLPAGVFVAACCSALQCVAVRCSALQYVALQCSALQCVAVRHGCGALQCIAVCCNVYTRHFFGRWRECVLNAVGSIYDS